MWRAWTTLLLLSLSASPALAHKVDVQCQLKGKTVVVEAFFDDDTPASDSRVRIENTVGKVIAEGRTDERGLWSFATPAAGPYQIDVNAGAGHRVRKPFTVPESTDSATTPGSGTAPTPTLTDGPSREESTKVPWLNVGLGLGIITVGALALRWLRQQRGTVSATP